MRSLSFKSTESSASRKRAIGQGWFPLFTACLVSSLVSSLICTQSVAANLYGRLLQDNEEGLGVAQVEIKAIGANPVRSDAQGAFMLQFAERKVGDEVHLDINLPGWRTLHPSMLSKTLPSSSNPTTIILCKIEECDAKATAYFRQKGAAAVKADYVKKLQRLEANLGVTSQQIAEATHEHDTALLMVEEIAKQLARTPPSLYGERYQKAEKMYLAGKLSDALMLLSEETLSQADLEIKKKLEESSNSWVLRGNLLVMRAEFATAAKAYDKAVAVSPDSSRAWFAFAFFHHKQNHFSQALQGYETALNLLRSKQDAQQIALVLNNLGMLHSAEGRFTTARESFDGALRSYRKLATSNPELYLPHIAMTLNNLGLLHITGNSFQEARSAYDEALQIYRELAKKDRATFLPDIATTLNNLGVLHSDERGLQEARKAYDEALLIRRELALKNPGLYLPAVATTLNNLGMLHNDQTSLGEARKAYDEALKIRRMLAAKNPDAYLPLVAITLNNLGILYSDENQIPEAHQAYSEALAIYRDLSAKNPGAYLPYVAQTLNNIGLQHSIENRIADARKAYVEAIAILRDFNSKNRSSVANEIARTEGNLANLPK